MSNGAGASEEVWRPSHNPWAIALTVTLPTFMEVLDTSVANVALPHIAGGLSAGEDEATWVLTSYLVSNAIVLPMSGWLSGLFGRKRFYMGCVVLFTLSSFLCGIAPNLPLLILFRVLQGMGGGGLQPSAQAILADTFAPAKRGMAFAVYGMAVVLAPAIGPTLGGWLTDVSSWRWIFFINIPVGILSLILTPRLVEDPPHMRGQKFRGLRIDYTGLGLLALGLGAMQVVLDKGQREDWFQSGFITVLTVVCVVSLVGVVFWELRQKDPIVEFRLMGDNTFLIGNVFMFMLGLVLLSSTVLLPLFLETLLGYTAQRAGMVISPGGFVILLLMPVVGFLVAKVDARFLIAFGLMTTSLSLLHMSSFNLQISFGTAMWARMFQAAGLAFLFVPINTMAFSNVPPGKSNAASGLINLARNVGGSIGISLVTTLLARRAQVHQNYLSGHMSAGDPQFQRTYQGLVAELAHRGADAIEASRQAYQLLYGTLVREATMLAYIDNFRYLAAVTMVIIPLVFLMKKGKSAKSAMPAH